MAYKKIVVGYARNTKTISGLYLGRFERIGKNKLCWVDPLRRSKGSQLHSSFQIWHTERNNFVVLCLNKYSKWRIEEFNTATDILDWLGSISMYNDLVRYTKKIHDLPNAALPNFEKMQDYKPQKVKSENWRKPLQRYKKKDPDQEPKIEFDPDFF